MRVFRKFTFTFVVESLGKRFPRRRTRRTLAAAAFVLLTAATGTAQAQSTVKLVGNAGQGVDVANSNYRFINDRAQAFTTGSAAGGYTLKRLDLRMGFNGITNPTAPAYTVKIHTAVSARPGTVLGTLTNPASVVEGTNSYTTDGIELAANTMYFVVIDVTGDAGNHHRIQSTVTGSDSEDADKAAGWSIGNTSLIRQYENTAWNSTALAHSWKMAIHGVVKASPPVPSGLMSNTGQEELGGVSFTNDMAQAFTTGGNRAKLTGVDLRVGRVAGTDPTYTVTIRQDSSGSPGSALGTLTNPASLPSSASNVRYAAPGGGIDLDANKTYWVVIDVTVGKNQTTARTTNSDAEDSGAPAGWSIADTRLRRWFTDTTWISETASVMIAIQGYIKSSQPTLAPAPPTLSKTDGTSLTITWKAPPAVLAPPTDYDVRYRRKGDAAWIDHPHSGTALTTTVNNLLQGASWEAQVAASNATGPGRWSDIGAGHTGPARFVSAETHTNGRSVSVYFSKDMNLNTAGGGFSANVGGVNRPSLGGSSISGNIARFGWSTNSADFVQPGQTVTVSYAKPSGVKLHDADNLEIANFGPKPVTNRVQAADPTAPGAPAAPTVSAVSSSRNLSVSWTAPTAGSSAISDYELRYYEGSSDPSDESDWVRQNEASGLPDPGTSTSATISGLKASTAYRVQVRAENGTGWGPWSTSGSATTNAASGTNSAPTRAQLGTSDCEAKTANTPFKTRTVASATLGSVDPITDDSNCGSVPSRVAPMFIDPDGDTLTFTARVENLPDNVILLNNTPFAHETQDRVYIEASAAFRQTDVRVDVTATDPSGATGSGHFIARMLTIPNSQGAPALGANPGPQRYALNAAIAPLVLPAATGGDGWSLHGYFYAVDGLPAGLTFDAATRTISGTPTVPGTYTVTYTAEDADETASAGRNPRTVDPSDTARLDFTIQVGNQPGIERVRIVSKPQFDSDGDGTADTYIKGAPIKIDVEFNEPVKVTGTIRLRFDRGKDDANLGNSRRTVDATSADLRHNGQTLRFTYTVGNSNNCSATTQQGDCDPDGIWVQTLTNASVTNKVLFPQTAASTIVHAVTGEAADLTYAHLPTPGTDAGDPLHKVDGSKNTPHVGPVASAGTVEVNGDTLTLDFAGSALATPSAADLAALRYEFLVQGAGGIGADDRGASQSPQAIVYSSVSGEPDLTLTLGAPARAGDTVTVSYVGTTLKGTGGKRAPMFRGLAVTNNTPGTAGPAPLHASVAGRQLRMLFKAPLDTSSLPAGSAFTVEAEDLDEDVRSIAGTGTATISGSVVTVTLASAMRADETGRVYYAKPSASPLRGSGSGNPEVRSFERWRIASASDGAAPKLLGGAVVQTGTMPAQSKLALYFDEALSTFSVPAAGDFSVRVGENAVTVSAAAVEGRSVVLTLDRLAAAGTAFEATYTPGTNPIRDWAGNAAAGFRQTVSAAASGTPALASAVAEGAKVVLTYDRPLDPASAPAADAFTLHTPLGLGETAADRRAYRAGVASVAVAGRTAVLHLEEPVFPCAGAAPLTVTYAVPGSSKLQGLDGADAAAFANRAATNGRTYRCNNSNWMHGARVGSVILRAKQPFATDVEPQASWFTVEASGGPVTVTAAAYSEDDPHELKLSISRDLAPGEEATVSYRRPEGAPGLWDADGNQLGDIEDRAVDNLAPGAPPAPAAPALTKASATGVSVSWTAPDTTGLEAVTGYDVQYRRGGATDWTDHEHAGADTATTITGLAAGARWQARVRAVNADGLGAWSEPGTGHTGPARLESAAMPEHGRGLVLTFTKDIHVSGVHTAYTVMVDGARRATGGASWDGATVSLVLAQPLRSGEAVTVAYAQPAGRTMLHDVDDLAVANFGPQAVANTVARAANAAATGAPAITGAARVGETLTASTAGIADANGMTGASYAWQWVSGDADIAGATSRTYTLAEADAGKRIKVRVSFTDDAGNRETLMSAATGAVAARLTPLTASFHDLPAEHDGSKMFTFELRFGEDFPGKLNYRVLRDEAFEVGNGRVRKAKRAAPGQNRRWTISVRPSSYEAVTLTLPAGSVTTESGRALAEAVSATVIGPALLSVADAEAREGPDAAVEFVVSLSRAASGTVTVDYMTRDGTAAAGEDYTLTRGTLTFAAGETRKTVSVPVLDDLHDEGRETFTLRLRNAKGAAIEDGEATGTIVNSDEMPRAWLARFGRAAAEHVVDAIGGRFGSSSGTRMTLGGQALALSADPYALTAYGSAPLTGAGPGPAESGPLLASANGFGLNERTGEDAEAPRHELSMPDLLLNSSFHMASAGGSDAGGAGSGRWSVWGRAARSSFEGAEGALTLKGDVTTATLGFDYERGRWLAGVALSRASGEGSYEKAGMRGEVESVLTGVYPYARYSVSERLSVWGVVGHGQGDMTLEPQGAASAETDIETSMAAGGARGVLLPARGAGAFELALRADLLAVETSSDSASNLVASEVGTSRLRLLIEASRSFRVGAESSLAASAEAGLRYDGGDAETGSGLEVGGSLRWTSGGLTVEVAARGLMAHSEDDYEEWGVSGSVQYAQAPDGRGLSLRAGSAWGAAAGGAERVWSQAPGGFRAGGTAPGAGLDAEAGYGFGFRGGLLTPYTGVALSDSGDVWRAGARWKLGPAFELALEASLRENTGGDDPESGVLLKGSRRW